jgi:hypothetical protein
MFELLAIGLVMGSILLVVGMVGALLKLLFWLVFLPLRLVGVFLKVALGLLFLPILAFGGLIALVGFGIAVLAPLLPIVVLGLIIWGVVKLVSPRSAVMPRV